MVNHYPQGSLINTTPRGGGGGNRNRSVAISLRGRESPQEAKRPEGTQKSAFVHRFASVEAFKIVTPNTIFQSDFMIMMMWISLSVYIKKLSIASAC